MVDEKSKFMRWDKKRLPSNRDANIFFIYFMHLNKDRLIGKKKTI